MLFSCSDINGCYGDIDTSHTESKYLKLSYPLPVYLERQRLTAFFSRTLFNTDSCVFLFTQHERHQAA